LTNERDYGLPSKYILNVLFTPCNLHWVILTSSSRMVIILLYSRTAWQSTGYPWKSLVKLVISLYEAINISRAGKWICGGKILTYTYSARLNGFYARNVLIIPETSPEVRVKSYAIRLRFLDSIPLDRTATDR